MCSSDLILWFQSWRTPAVELFFKIVTFTGEEYFYLIMLPILYWCVDTKLARRVTPFLLISAWVNAWCKEWWQRPRPVMVSAEVKPALNVPDFGLPSGHAQCSLTFWGAIAFYLKRRGFTLFVIFYVPLVCVSRLVLGVHYPQDIVGGLAIAAILLVLYYKLEPSIARWISLQSMGKQIGIVTLATAGMACVYPLTFSSAYEYAVPKAVSLLALFWGSGIDLVLEFHRLQFDSSGVWWKKVVRFFLGIFILIVIRFGLDAIFEDMQPMWVYRMITYSIVGLWMCFGAPWLFIKIKIGQKTAPQNQLT